MQKRTNLMYPLLALFLTIFSFSAQISFAQADSPAGLWQSIDDKTGQPRSLIRIEENNGTLTGTVEKGLLPTDTGDAVCDKCKDDRKDQPIIGMSIIRGLTKNGDKYDGGTILDPDNGKVYKCKLKLDDTGNQLEVRGYIGISLIGRSQTWTRAE